MPRGGSKPGERRGGRQKGSLKVSIGRMKAQLVGSAPPSVLFALVQRVGADRLVMGSDHPVSEPTQLGL